MTTRAIASLLERADAQAAGLPSAPPGKAARSEVGNAAATADFEVVGTSAGLAALTDEWSGLFARCATPHHVFQTIGFARTWAQAWLEEAGAAPHRSLAVVTARRGGELVLVMPLVRERTLGFEVLGWLGEPVAQYGDILVADVPDRLELMLAAWSHVTEALRPDVVRLRKVRADAAVMPLLCHIGAVETERNEAPSVGLRAGTGASFEERQSGKARKNRRRLMRRLEEQGRVELVQAPGDAHALPLIAAGLGLKREWLHRRGLLSRAFTDPRLDRFFAIAAGGPLAPTGLEVFALKLDGRPVAVALGFACKRRLTLHMISYAADVEKSGVGVLNLEAILRAAEARGLEAVDLLAPAADYKLDWADGTVAVADHVVALSLAGRACVRLRDSFLVPRLKRSMDRVPLRLRRLIAPRG